MTRQTKNILILMITVLLTLGFSRICLANQLLVLTENSSTELTANIGVVTNISPDAWVWDPPPAPPGLAIIGARLTGTKSIWVEPDTLPPPAPGLTNTIHIYPGFPSQVLLIQSDIPITYPTPITTIPDSAISLGLLNLNYSNGTTTTFDVQFIDNGDVPATTPEPATILLLGSGLLGSAGLWRRFKI